MIVSGSANIATLDMAVLYDLSGPSPMIRVTNRSTGSGLAACTWWFIVTSPSGAVLHTASLGVPDRMGAWSTWTMPNAWPQLYNHIEWSGAPYSVTLYVNDGAGHTYDLPYTAEIQPPLGNNGTVKNNNGVAYLVPLIKCNSGQVYAQDETNYLYSNSNGVLVSEIFTMKYPSNNGVPTADALVTGTTYAYFNISFNANGYKIILNTVRDYLVANNSTVRILYTGQEIFNVQCSVDMCNLLCGYQKMLAKAVCAPCSSDDLRLRMTKICAKVNLALIGIVAGCTQIDLADLVNDIKKILGEFDCCCDGDGVNSNVFPTNGCNKVIDIVDKTTNQAEPQCPNSFYPATVYEPDGVTAIGTATDILNLIALMNGNAQWQAMGKTVYNGSQCSVGFLPVDCDAILPVVKVSLSTCIRTISIINKESGVAPDPCPDSFFPATVYAPNGVTAIGSATSIYALIAIMNSNTAWEALGVAFYNGNQCDVKFVPNDCADSIPTIKVTITDPSITLNIIDGCTGIAPVPCPGSFYPCILYKPDGITAIMTTITSVADLVAAMNGDPDWSALGTASLNGTDQCDVTFSPISGGLPANIIITTGPCCMGSDSTYLITVNDICYGTSISGASFPLNLVADFGDGSGAHGLGSVADMAALVAALNGSVFKPLVLTFFVGSPIGAIIVHNSDCTDYTGTIVITCDAGSTNYLLYGANHCGQIGAFPGVAAEQGIGLKTSSLLGKFGGAAPSGIVIDEPVWHTILIGGRYLIVSSPNTVIYEVRVYDVIDPLNHVLLHAINLPSTGSPNANWAGNPDTPTVSSGGIPIPSRYGLYFPTDNPAAMSINEVYVCESTTGSIWKMDCLAGTVTSYFWAITLRGKTPRVIIGNALRGGTLYFSQDGDMEQSGGLASGVAPLSIVKLNLSLFSSAGLSVQALIVTNPEYFWAASFDGIDTIWWVGNAGTIVKYSISSGAVISSYIHALDASLFRLNIKFYNGFLFCCSMDFAGRNTGTLRIDTTVLPTVVIVPFSNFTPTGSIVDNNKAHHNFLPLGNCLGLVTYDNFADGSHPQGGVAIFKIDGTFVGLIQLAEGDMYNVVAIAGISDYVPNNLV